MATTPLDVPRGYQVSHFQLPHSSSGAGLNPTFGRDPYRFQVIEGFFRRPRNWSYVDVVDVDVDADDNVYLFHRGPHPVMVFDKAGNFLDTWGELGVHFTRPHGLSVSADGDVYTADDDAHVIRRWTKEGKLLLTIGRPYINTPEWAGVPFCRPTKATISSTGDIYVSDGYGNSHVHCFDPDGKHKFTWGGRGSANGQFDIPHDVFVDVGGGDTVYVTDHYNDRIQIFTSAGEYVDQWTGLEQPQRLYRGPDGNFYVAHRRHHVSILDSKGSLLVRWGQEDALVDDTIPSFSELALPTSPSRNPPKMGRVRYEPGPGRFCAPHGIAVDSEGSLYVAEVSESAVGLDRGDRSVQKFARVTAG